MFKSLPLREDIGELNEENAIKRRERREKAYLAKQQLSTLLNSDKQAREVLLKAAASLSKEDITKLVLAQPYRLSYYKIANDELNYRRFFDINELMAIKVERQEVFEEHLELVCKWIKVRHYTTL